MSDEEIAQREADARAREQAAEAERTAVTRTSVEDNHPPDPEVVQIRILAELQAIRYRLSVLVVFLVIVPIAVGLIIGFAIGFD